MFIGGRPGPLSSFRDLLERADPRRRDRGVAGEGYHDATFELVVLFFDPPHRRWHLVPVRTAPWLPDGNQPRPPGEPPPERVYVEAGVLFVATDPSGKTFERYQLDELVPW